MSVLYEFWKLCIDPKMYHKQDIVLKYNSTFFACDLENPYLTTHPPLALVQECAIKPAFEGIECLIYQLNGPLFAFFS